MGGTIIFSFMMLWFIGTLVSAALQNWKLWCAAIFAMFLLALPGLALGIQLLPLQMIGVMAIYFWPVAVILGSVCWVAHKLNAALGMYKDK